MSGHKLHAEIGGGWISYSLTCEDDCGSLDIDDVRIPGSKCWLVDWVDAVGGDVLAGDGWPIDPHFPLAVAVDPDCSYDEPTLIYVPS